MSFSSTRSTSRWRSAGSRQVRLVIALLAGLAVGTAKAEERFEADKVFERAKKISLPELVQINPQLIILPRDVSKHAPAYLISPRPWLYELTAPAARVPGVITFEVRPSAGYPVYVVPRELIDCSDIEFQHALWYLSANRQLAHKLGSPPGAVHRGVAMLLAHCTTSATEFVWSIDPDEAAVVYLIAALNRRPLDFGPLRLENPGVALTDAEKRNFGAQVRQALQQLHPRNAVAIADRLLNDPRDLVLKKNGETEDWPPRLIDALTSPAELHDDAPTDASLRERIERLVIQPVLGASNDFSFLPARLRLLAAARRAAAGRDVVVEARRERGLPVNEERLTAGQLDALKTFRQQARELFENDVRLRSRGAAIPPDNAVEAVREINRMAYDPRAMVEVVGILISDSVEFAKAVRVPLSESKDPNDQQILAGVQQAFGQDVELKSFFARYGQPTPRIVRAPGTPFGKALVLHWDFHWKGERIGGIDLYFEDSFSRGGSGLPIPPGLLLTQPVLASPTVPATDPPPVPFVDVQVRHFLGTTPPVTLTSTTFPTERVWCAMLSRETWDLNVCVTVTAQGRQVAGTPSQKILARRDAKASWDWLEIGTLRAGDEAWIDGAGAQRISGVRRDLGVKSFARPVVAGSDHLVADGFFAYVIVRPVEEQSRHGIVDMTQVRTGKNQQTRATLKDLSGQLSWTERRFVEIEGVNADAKQPEALRDLLVQLHPESSRAICWIVYRLDGAVTRLGINPHHGLLVSRPNDTVATVPAYAVRPGDRLYRDVTERGATFTTVESVGWDIAPEGQAWALLHPKLLRCEWMQAQGVIVHTDKADQEPGILGSARVQLLDVAPQRVAKESGLLFRIGASVEARQLGVAPVSARGTRLDTAEAQVILAAHPGAATLADPQEVFQPRLAAWVKRTVVSGVFKIRTKNGLELQCAPAQEVWREVGDPAARKDRFTIETVEARLLGKGQRIVTLSGGNSLALELNPIVSVDWLDGFASGAPGFFEVYAVRFADSPVKLIREHQKQHTTLFGNGVGVLTAMPGKKKDLWLPSAEPGPGPGSVKGPAGTVSGALEEAAALDKCPFTVVDFGAPSARRQDLRLQFSPDDYEIFRRGADRLAQAIAAFRKSAVQLPPRETEQRRRLEYFVTGVLKQNTAQDVCTQDNFELALSLYLDARADLLKERHPESLEMLSRAGLRLAWPLQASGGPGRLLLEDLLTIHMRLVLRPRGEQLWAVDALGARPTLQFVTEFEQLAGLGKASQGFAVFRKAEADPADWIDLLQAATQEGRIHSDVLRDTDQGRQAAMVYRLCVQLDELAGVKELPRGMIFPGLDPESAPQSLYSGLNGYLNRN